MVGRLFRYFIGLAVSQFNISSTGHGRVLKEGRNTMTLCVGILNKGVAIPEALYPHNNYELKLFLSGTPNLTRAKVRNISMWQFYIMVVKS